MFVEWSLILPQKSYRLGDLRDLQSKLSLLVGAGNRQEQMAMQTFVHTVDRIEAAAEVLAQLVVSGHPKSNSLKFNAPYEHAMSCIEVEQNEWEKLLASWTETVRRLRESNRLLNLFTINQLQVCCCMPYQPNFLCSLSFSTHRNATYSEHCRVNHFHPLSRMSFSFFEL